MPVFIYSTGPLGDLTVPGHSVIACSQWETLLADGGRATASVLDCPRLDHLVLEQLRELRRRWPCLPLILVTEAEPDNARHLATVVVDVVLWSHEVQECAGDQLARVIAGTILLPRLLACVDASTVLNDGMKRHLLIALQADPPFRTVKRWAHTVGCTPRALEKAWRRGMAAAPPLRQLLRIIPALRQPADKLPGPVRHLVQALMCELSSESIDRFAS